jgi:CMP/dCMP kinase
MKIAIDGPAASGKGTLARRLAEHYGLAYLDTGSLYRAVARDVMAAGGDLEDERLAAKTALALDHASLSDIGLRDPGVGEKASIVAKFPTVRTALRDFQRSLALTPPGAVLDGRDIGTVVLPDADAKIFVTADVKERARRRHAELLGRGESVTYDHVLDVITRRDARDQSREASPMKAAADATVLDTTTLDAEAAFRRCCEIIDQRMGRR